MTRRDLHWRLAGLALFGGAAAAGFGSNAAALQSITGASALLGLVGFLFYLAGALLVIQGERLPAGWSGRRLGRPHFRRPQVAKKRRSR